MAARSPLVCAPCVKRRKSGGQARLAHDAVRHTGRRKQRVLVASLALGLSCGHLHPLNATEPTPVTIAVFGFELDDRSAGGGIVDPDEVDGGQLKSATEQAHRLLEESGRYRVIDGSGAAGEIVSAGGLRNCDGCESALAQELGADQSLAGIITRVTRTEYTVQIVVRDSRTGEVLANDFTGLRMGANYSWPRGVKSLMNKGILSAAVPQ